MKQDSPRPGQQPGGSVAGPGRQVYRSAGPVVVWWVWLAFAVINLADLAVQGRDHFSAMVAAIIVLVTGMAYACALRPRIVADEAGIGLRNPVRDYQVPWAAVTAVDLSQSLRVHTRAGDPPRDKALDSWAVQTTQRARARAGMRAARSDLEMARRSPSYDRLPPEAREAKRRTAAELIAWALDERARHERRGGSPSGGAGPGAAVIARWAWPSIAAMLLPAIALVIVALS